MTFAVVGERINICIGACDYIRYRDNQKQFLKSKVIEAIYSTNTFGTGTLDELKSACF